MTTAKSSNFKLARPLFFLGLFLFPLFSFSQDYNGGFEKLHPSGAPVGWARNDVSATAVTSGAFAGKKAIKAWINDFYLVGIWNNYSPEAVSQSLPGATADKTPTNLSGIYWYDGHKSECETALITVFAGTQGPNGVYDTLAYTQEELFLNKEYEPFSFEIDARSDQSPEFVSIQLEPRGKCYYRSAGKCCYLTMDELRFEQDIEKVEATVKAAKSPWVKSDLTPVRVNPDNVRRTKNERRLRRKKLRKKRKGRSRTGPFYRKPKQPEGEPAVSEPIPIEIQKEVDRINKYQEAEEVNEVEEVEFVEEEIKPLPEAPAPQEPDNTSTISDEVIDDLKMSEEEVDDSETLQEGFGGDDVSEEGSSEDDEYFPLPR